MSRRSRTKSRGISRWIGRGVLAALFLTAQAPAFAKDKVTRLFQDSSTLTIDINGPLKDIVRRASRSTDPREATLVANGETHRINLSARGVSRRQRASCFFPPLRVKFLEKPAKTSLFAKQGSLKLVTHCKDNDRFEQIAMREYATYRIYNLFTTESLKTRLVRVRYMDGQKPYAERFGFFIEDIDDAARRLGGKEIDVPRVSASSFNRAAAARYSLFQYMIGNTDWAMMAGPAGSDCCHNSKLVGANKAARSNLIPVPYDFDSAGLVNAPYAQPSERVPIKTVRQRYYRGFCSLNPEVKQVAATFLQKRDAIAAEIGSLEGLADSSRKQMLGYINGFYKQLEKPQALDKRILKTCR